MTSYLIAGPGEEPVSRAEAKAFCRIDGADEDALVDALITAARLHVEGLTGRALVTQTWRLVRHRPPLVVTLPVLPATELIAAPDGAVLDGECVRLVTTPETLTLDYIAGYGDAAAVPADLRQAVLTLVAYWYEHRDAVTVAPRGFDRLVAAYRRARL